MKKEARVHRLRTEDKSNIWKWRLGLTFMKNPSSPAKGAEGSPQHLYITTDEDEFDIDEYVLFTGADMPKVFKVKAISQDYLEDSKGTNYNPDYCEKIIATTDLKLGVSQDYKIVRDSNHISKVFQQLPQIPQSFIEEYCKAGGIDEVLVEVVTGEESEHDGYCQMDCSGGQQKNFPECCRNIIYPKLDSNNCIIIHPVEEKMYSEDVMAKALVDFSNDFLKVRNQVTESEAKKWIKEKLITK